MRPTSSVPTMATPLALSTTRRTVSASLAARRARSRCTPAASPNGRALSTHVTTKSWVIVSTQSGYSSPISATAPPWPRTAAPLAHVATTSTPMMVSRKGSLMAAQPSAGMTAIEISPASLSWPVKPTVITAMTAPQVRTRLQPSTTPGWGTVSVTNGSSTRYDDRWARNVPAAISRTSVPSIAGPATTSTAVAVADPTRTARRKSR
jgi:hypothetical protein